MKKKKKILLHLLAFLLCGEGGSFLPGIKNLDGLSVNVREEVGPELDVAHEVDGDGPHLPVYVTGQSQHGPPAHDLCNARRAAVLKQPPLALQYEPVELGVCGHDRRLPQQVHPKYPPVPFSIKKESLMLALFHIIHNVQEKTIR